MEQTCTSSQKLQADLAHANKQRERYKLAYREENLRRKKFKELWEEERQKSRKQEAQLLALRDQVEALSGGHSPQQGLDQVGSLQAQGPPAPCSDRSASCWPMPCQLVTHLLKPPC